MPSQNEWPGNRVATGSREVERQFPPEAPAHYFLCAALFAVSLLPILLYTPLLLGDYANHLARVYILSSIQHSEGLQKFYEVHWQIIPNLAMDIIVPWISRLLPVETAMMIFTVLTLALICVGVFSVHRGLFQRASASPIAVFLFLYNRQFLGGFLNYLFGLGTALLTFAAWIRMRNSGTAARSVVFAVLLAFVFICHLGAFGVVVVLICGFELQAGWKSRKLRSRAVLLGVLLLGGTTIVLFLVSPLGHLPSNVTLGTLREKLAGVFDVFNNYDLPLDIGSFLLVVTTFLIGYAARKAEFKREMILPTTALCALYCVMPFGIFNVSAVDRRLMIAIALVAVGSTNWRLTTPWARRLLVATATALFVLRMAVIAENWRKADRVYAEELAVIDRIPNGIRLASAVGVLSFPFLRIPPLAQLPNMAVVRRNALVNSLFAKQGHTVVHLRVLPDDVRSGRNQNFIVRNDLHQTISTDNPYDVISLCQYDFLLVINKQYFPYSPPSVLLPVYGSQTTTLYRIQHDE